MCTAVLAIGRALRSARPVVIAPSRAASLATRSWARVLSPVCGATHRPITVPTTAPCTKPRMYAMAGDLLVDRSNKCTLLSGTGSGQRGRGPRSVGDDPQTFDGAAGNKVLGDDL